MALPCFLLYILYDMKTEVTPYTCFQIMITFPGMIVTLKYLFQVRPKQEFNVKVKNFLPPQVREEYLNNIVHNVALETLHSCCCGL